LSISIGEVVVRRWWLGCGYFNSLARLRDAISGAEAYADIIELYRKAKSLQNAVLAYLNKYEGHDLSEELLGVVTLLLTDEQREG
jgi:hypothetical protein